MANPNEVPPDYETALIEIGRLRAELNHIIPWARRIRCILKTRELLERYENQFAPGYRNTTSAECDSCNII